MMNVLFWGLTPIVVLWLLSFVFVLGFVISMISKTTYMVRQSEVIILERLGKFHKVLHPGIHFVVPFIDTPHSFHWTVLESDPVSGRSYRYSRSDYRIDLREAIYDFPRQNVITRDNVTMQINALLFYQITDPQRAIYEIQNLPESIEKLAQTKLREVIGSLDLDESLVSRDIINSKLQESLDAATDKWGVKVNRVELQEITPPQDIKIAMEKQMRAERDRRAVVLEAEGEKQAAILKAEGDKASRITRASGEAESKRVIAEGEALALKALAQANSKIDPAQYMLALNYIKAFSEMTSGKDNKTVILPYEASSVLGSISTIRELLGNGADSKALDQVVKTVKQ